jgi:DNA invertase Pin-like site-specific DNA recombinase
MGLTYFYDYFAKEYRESRKGKLLPDPAAIFWNINPEDVQSCRRVLKNAYANYRGGRNVEVLKQLTGEYRKYVSCSHDEQARDRYNAFVYRYLLEVPVGSRAIASKLGVVKETVFNYVNRCFNEMLVLCMGMPAVGYPPEDREAVIRMLVDGSRLFSSMAGDYILCLFPGKREREAVDQGRRTTIRIMRQLGEAVEAYSGYCNDGYYSIDTDIRKVGILQKCIAGVSPAAIAEEYGCCQSTVYADIRENERRLAAMLFDN